MAMVIVRLILALFPSPDEIAFRKIAHNGALDLRDEPIPGDLIVAFDPNQFLAHKDSMVIVEGDIFY